MKIKNILSTIILVLILTLTVGFSAFVSEMSISNLVAEVRLNENVRITGVSVVSSSNGSMNSLDYDEDSILGNVYLKVINSTLTLEVEVTNFGNAVMGIESHSGSTETLIYPISGYEEKTSLCDESGNCTLGSVTKFNVTLGYDYYDPTVKDHEFKLDFVFKKMHSITYTDITNNNYPSYIMDGQTLSVNLGSSAPSKLDVYSNGIKLSTGYSYVNGILTISEVTGDIEVSKYIPVAKLVSGDLTTIGSEVCIKDECFYIINNDGSKVTMLAKYNLHVGNIVTYKVSEVDNDNNDYVVKQLNYIDDDASALPLLESSGLEGDEYSDFEVTPIENSTGIQNNSANGCDDSDVRVGVLNFSSSLYWREYNSETRQLQLKSTYGTDYAAYIYDSNSMLYSYIENYKEYLNNLGTVVTDSRLISDSELNSIGCVDSSCSSGANWIYSSSYWTGMAYNHISVKFVKCDGTIDYGLASSDYYGLRPVIEISVEDIYVPPVAKVVSGDYDTVGSEVCLENECFYVISSTDDSVTMLSKYNLLVGNSVDENWNVTPLANSTGIQDSSARGYFEIDEGVSGFPIIGTVPFSSTDTTSYEDSTIKDYVDNYGLYLKSTGFNLNDVRLLTFDEIMEFSHSKNIGSTLESGLGTLDSEEYVFSSAPSWLYSTSYWLGSALDDIAVYRIDTSAFLHPDMPELDDDVSVRPVITISKDYF